MKKYQMKKCRFRLKEFLAAVAIACAYVLAHGYADTFLSY